MIRDALVGGSIPWGCNKSPRQCYIVAQPKVPHLKVADSREGRQGIILYFDQASPMDYDDLGMMPRFFDNGCRKFHGFDWMHCFSASVQNNQQNEDREKSEDASRKQDDEVKRLQEKVEHFRSIVNQQHAFIMVRMFT